MQNFEPSGLILAVLVAALHPCAASAASAAGTGPVASISPASVRFAAQPPGVIRLKYLMIASTGTTALHIASISIDNPVFTPKPESDCAIGSAGGINPSFVCDLYVVFAPVVAGRYTATITIVDDAPDSPQTVPITATATGIEIQPNSLKFHLVEPGQVTAPQTVTVTDWGSAPVTISSIATTGASAAEYIVQSNTCPTTLAPGAFCTLQLEFAPTAQGKAQAALTVTDSDLASPQQAVLLGDGTDVLLTPQVVSFGKITVGDFSKPVPVKITNSGSAQIAITGVSVNNFDKTSAFFLENNGCSSTLTAGASCFVQVIFEPDEDGLKVGQLVVTDSDGGSPQTAELYGTGEF